MDSVIFAWVIFGSWLAFKLIFHFVVWNRARTARLTGAVEDYLPRIKTIFAFIEILYYLLAIPVWFFWSMNIWPGFNSAICFEGWIVVDFINIMLIYCYASCFAIAAAILVPCCICCLPCICAMWRERQEAMAY